MHKLPNPSSPRSLYARRLRRYIALLGGVLVASIIAVSVVSMWVAREQEMSSWHRELQNVSMQLAQQTALEVSSAYLILDHVADTVARAGLDTPAALRSHMGSRAVHDSLRQEAHNLPQIDVVSIVADNGDLVNFTRSHPPPSISLADRDYFHYQSVRRRDAVFISRPVRNKGNGEWTFYISKRLESPSGRFLGVALVGFSSSFLSKYYGKIALGAGASVTLYRDDLTILARWPESQSLMGVRNTTGSTHQVIDVLKQDSGVLFGDGPSATEDGRRVTRMSAVRRLEHYPLIVNVTVTEDVVLASWRRTRDMVLGVAVCCVLAINLAFFLLWCTFRRRERDLVSMEALKMQAEAANAAKSSFLAMMSHEIRTPLTSVIGFAELLDTETQRARRQEVGKIIVRNGKHLLGILDEILDISKIEAGALQVHAAAFSPSDTLAAIDALMRPQAQAKGVALRVEIVYPFPAQVSADAMRWRQILFNLVSNALKFTDAGEVRVVAGYDAAAQALVTTVSDTGVGMAAAEIDALFLPFSQAGPEVAGRFGGTGLGLYLARRLAQAMGGDIGVQSQPGVGSRFELRVQAPPLAAVPMLESAPPAAPAETAVASVPALPRLAGTVLLAEDFADNRLLVSTMLSHMGLRCVAVENGAQALAAGQSAGVDLVLMDIQMPVMDGLQSTAALRQAGFDKPIVALTANVMPEDLARCQAAGCDEVLAKPVAFAALRAVLARLLGVQAVAVAAVGIPDADMDRLMARFDASLPDRIGELTAALDAADWVAAAASCHKIKGAAASFGHAGLGDMARELERAILRRDMHAVGQLDRAIRTYGQQRAPARAA